MSDTWTTIVALCLGTLAIKAAGPLALGGGRTLSPRAAAVIGLVAPALLSALVVYETLGGTSRGIHVDARLVGVAAAAAALAARLPMLVAVLAAAVATALARALV